MIFKGQEAHWEVVQRILFLYAKLNPGQSYVQGMNEIIGPIYYVFASDPNNEWKGNVLQVNLFQKHLFLHQLTHNMTTDCSSNYDFSTRKL